MGLSTPESARADAKSITSSSKSICDGRPHDSSDTLGASSSPALTLMSPLTTGRIAKPKCESERKIFERWRCVWSGRVRSPHVPRRRVNSAMPAPTMAADSYACTYGVHIQQHHSPTRPYLFPYPVLRPGASATSTAHHMQYMLCCCCW